MSQLFAERFKTARKMNSHSLEDLSIKLNKKITKQGLHKYEKGEDILLYSSIWAQLPANHLFCSQSSNSSAIT
jgi:hypothetical protein